MSDRLAPLFPVKPMCRDSIASNRPVLDFMLRRRSILATNLDDPGPNDEDLDLILQVATRVPDHGRLTPWRIKVCRKPAQTNLASIYRASFLKHNPNASDAMITAAHRRLTASPLLLVVVAQPNMDRLEKIPLIEQQLSAGVVCSNILIAAAALGYGGQWLTGGPAYDRAIHAALGLSEYDSIAGFMHIGTPSEPARERIRPPLEDIVEEWTG
ncbi:MAG: nitroreductase [Pseudomonadota bacterium]